MKHAHLTLAVLLIASCGSAEQPGSNNINCEFSFDHLEPCVHRIVDEEITVRFNTSVIADDEIALHALEVANNDHLAMLTVTADTLIAGDVGYISFVDINFDSIPDLALTTSFGTPNLYLDYWVYNPDQKNYVAVGNLPMLTIDSVAKTLTAEVKINAASYEKKTWGWREGELVLIEK